MTAGVALFGMASQGVDAAPARNALVCQFYTKLDGLSGTLAAGAATVVREWTTGCPGAVMTSAGVGIVILERLDGGRWSEVGRGISVNVTGQPAGAYRLRVYNQNFSPMNYRVRLVYGIS
jgi:hypothetical protein